MQDIRKKEIRMAADSFRMKCRISRYGIIDLFKECERLGYKLLRYPLGDNADLGFAVKKDRDIVIFTNSSSRLSREIFTLAHELGHAILHLNEESSFIDDNFTINDTDNDQREQEANYFAACLLMPADDINRFVDFELQDFEGRCLSAMDIARIMSEFHVSFDMVLNRLEDAGIINSNQKLYLNNEKTMKRVGNLLQSVGGNAKLNQPSCVVHIPYEYISYAIFNYNHSAIPVETLENVLQCYGLSIEDVSDKITLPTDKDEDDFEKKGIT